MVLQKGEKAASLKINPDPVIQNLKVLTHWHAERGAAGAVALALAYGEAIPLGWDFISSQVP